MYQSGIARLRPIPPTSGMRGMPPSRLGFGMLMVKAVIRTRPLPKAIVYIAAI